MARDKREFTEDSGLGFMRLVQFFNVFALVCIFISLIFVRGASVRFDFTVITNVLLMLSQAVVIWLIARRKLYTRQIIIGIEIFEIAVVAIQDMMAGTFDPFLSLFGAIPNFIMIAYFACSRRAKAVLVQPWSDQSILEHQVGNSRGLWDPKSIDFWMRLLIYFFVFSIIGHWMEMGVQILVVNGIIPGTIATADSLTWRDSLNPFFIYGIAFSFCGLVLYPAFLWLSDKLPHRWQALTISFIFNMAFCVAAELILGFLFNADYSAWDYRNQFMNFEGQVCLLYSIAFGVMSSLMTWIIYPMLEHRFANLNRDVFRVIFVAAFVLYLMIYATYNVDLDTMMPGQHLSLDMNDTDDPDKVRSLVERITDKMDEGKAGA